MDPASADAVVIVGLLQRLARPAAFLEVMEHHVCVLWQFTFKSTLSMSVQMFNSNG